MLIRVTEANTDLWRKASEVSRRKYNKSYNARINPIPQYYVVVQTEESQILACAGITFADGGVLFSEQYLNSPIESILQTRLGKKAKRSHIAEIGTLTSRHTTAGTILVNMIPMLAWCMGARYLLCTVTPRVITMMEECQIPFEPIKHAESDRLEEAEHSWGTYYNQTPVTGFIQVDPKRSRFAALTVGTVFAHTLHTPPCAPKRVS